MTSIQRFEDASAFRLRVEPLLLAHEAESNLLLGLISTLEAAPDFYGSQPYFAALFEQDALTGAAIMTPPHQLVVSRCDSEAAMQVLAVDVHSFRPDTPGVQAPGPTGRWFAEVWQQLTQLPFSKSMAERIYRLDQVFGVTDVGGKARWATQDDIELLTDWWLAFAAEALPGAPEPRDDVRASLVRRLGTPLELRGTLLWDDGGEPVSLVGYGGATPNSMRIGPVYTPPQFRRRGYASACTAAACQYLLDSGRKFCTLFTDLSNPTSNHIYQAIGFEPVCDVEQYRFGAANHPT